MQSRNGRPAARRVPDDMIILPTKVGIPGIRARVEEWRQHTGVRLYDFDAVRLVQVATRTGPREIVELREAATRARNDMLNVKGGAL
jgi:hypothetical protein